MAHTFEALQKMKVAELRKIAKGLDHEALKGHAQMNKDPLLQALCTALGIQAQAEGQGFDKRAAKTRIRALKVERQKALDAKDREALRRVRHRIRRLKRKLRSASA